MTLLALVLLALPATGCSGGGEQDGGREPVAAANEPPPERPDYMQGPSSGRWHEPRSHAGDAGLTDEQREAIGELESLGYAAGVAEGEGLSGVTRHDRERAGTGVNLVTSADAAHACLMDMEGKVLHEWSLPFAQVWPQRASNDKLSTFWRRTHLYENGDLLAIYEGLGMIKVDRDSKLLWASDVRAHHDLEVTDDGRIWVLTREAHMDPAISSEKPVLEDFVSIVGPEDGLERRRFSLLDALEGTPWAVDWSEQVDVAGGDLLHTNSLEVLDGRLTDVDPAFAKGNLLVSMLLLDLVCVLDPQAGKVVWGHVGPYRLQHDPHVLDAGTVMVFDNQGGAGGASRVLEMDPASWEPVWSYAGSAAEPFYSETCGLAQRLSNGNTLITESDYGRAFEVTADGAIVWEYHNPHRAGPDGRYVATLMEVLRLPADFPLDWVKGPQ